MSTNSFEAGKHEDALEASQISKFYCNGCKRYFKTKRGLTLHQRSCKQNPRNREQSVISTIDVSHDDQNIVVTDTVFKWGDIDGKTFTETVELIYEKIVYWKNIVFKAIMIMPNLLLQKPSKNSKAKDHLTALERRMQSWLKGDLMELLHGGETIQ